MVSKIEIENKIYELRVQRAKHYDNNDIESVININKQINELRALREFSNGSRSRKE